MRAEEICGSAIVQGPRRKRRARLLLFASVCAALTTQPGAAGVQSESATPIQSTSTEITNSPAVRKLRELVAALAGSENMMVAFAEANPGPPPPPGPGPKPMSMSMLDMMRETKFQSHGYTVLSFKNVTANEASALVRNNLTQQIEEMMVRVAAEPPHPMRGWGMKLDAQAPARIFSSDAKRVEHLSAYLKRLADADTFSGVVIVARNGKPILQKAYGFADREARVPNTLETRFRLASLSKIFTGFAIGRLVEQGKLSYDDPLSKFIPDFPDAESAKKIRIKHLLSHTSGLPGFFPPAIHNVQKNGSTAIGVAALSKEPLEFEPGTKWSYSNTGLLLLGRVIEIVTGETYFEHLQRTMFGPLGLTQIGFPDYDHPTGGMIAKPYQLTPSPDGKLRLQVFEDRTRWGGPAGDAAASAPDLLRFATLLEDGRIVSPATLRLHTTPKPELNSPDYGYAVDFDFAGRAIYGHSGGAPGTCTQLGVINDLPEAYTFVVLANGHGRACRPVVNEIVSTFARPKTAEAASAR